MEFKINANKRVFGYLVDGFGIVVLDTALHAITKIPMVGTIVGTLALFFRDSIFPQGSPGKRLAGLRIEGGMATFPARLKTSFLRNLPLMVVPMIMQLLPLDPRGWAVMFWSMMSLVVLVVEYVRMINNQGVRFGDSLAKSRVVALDPTEHGTRYFFYSLLVVLLQFLFMMFVSLYVYPRIGIRP